jgi:Phage portal protein
MNIQERVEAAWKALRGERKTAVVSGVPAVIQRMGQRAEGLPKATPVNLRKMAETPVARKAINTIKDRIACMRWEVREVAEVRSHPSPAAQDGAPGGGEEASQPHLFAGRTDGAPRIELARRVFAEPNPGDSFRTLVEQVLEDVLVGGFGAVEMEETGDPSKPLNLWPVDGATIQIKPDWDGKAESVRYAQQTGQYGEKGLVQLRDTDLMYVRSNPRTHTPFGLGRMEVAFEAVNDFLGANRYAARLASNSVVQYALWIDQATPQQQERLIRWWQDEIEGTGRVPLLSCESKPEVLQFNGGTDAELRLQWQEFLMRVIACAFDLPPMALGIERDVNRNTATEAADEAFRTAIRPTALLIAEHFTRDVLGKRLGWDDLEFVFLDLETRDEMDELEMQLKLLQAGVVSVDEVRQWRGLGSKEHGGGGVRTEG